LPVRSVDFADIETLHKVADAITAAVDVPFIHIADTTADAVHAEGLGPSACSPPPTP
jgi:aspartate/glutamate racemase